MDPDDRILRYLALDPGPAGPFAFAWASNGEAVEAPPGRTFAFAAQVARFAEGFAPHRLPHFRHLLLLLAGLGLRSADDRVLLPAAFDAFRETGRPLRNAGLLCARLCERVPPASDPPDGGELAGWLLSARNLGRLAAPPSRRELPPLGDDDFLKAIRTALAGILPEELRRWLRHGTEHRDGSPTVARHLADHKPPSLVGTLAEIFHDRPRLRAATPLVPSLAGALSLPPRRLQASALPTGGYADVTTRGTPERLLPGQFALDPDEFVRRFAENELLYFRREDPHRRGREEMLLLLDQGIRTWGAVRLLLAAAVPAFARLAARRGVPVLAATTGRPAPFDPLATDVALGEALEAADFTTDPADALEVVLAAEAERDRDVVLLTHPRSLSAPAVAAAAAGLRRPHRLFALAADETGEVTLSEWRAGSWVRVSRCRVDLSLADRLPAPARRGLADGPAAWAGAIEPLPFPFPCGPIRPLVEFAFDAAREWLAARTAGGLLHTWSLDGRSAEMLPRGRTDAGVLRQPDALLGLAGGFAACGRLGAVPVVIHYDLAARRARAHALGPGLPTGADEWFAFPDQHSVVLRAPDRFAAVDLATGEGPERSRRAADAVALAHSPSRPSPGAAVRSSNATAPGPTPWILVSPGGMLTVAAATDTWPPFTPLADGRPLLNAATAEEAQVAGNHLALLWRGDGSPHLTLFRGPEGAVVCDFPAKNPTTFRLSGDGRLLARTAGKSMCEAEVVATAIGPPVLRAARGKYHPDPGVQTGRGWVAVVVGKLATLFRWVGGPLEVQRLTFSAPAGLTRLMAEVGVGDWPGTAVQKRTASAGEPWDLERVPRLAALPGGRCVLVDVLGQVFLTHAAGKVAAALMVWRDQSAGWLPDGTRFGPKPLSGFAETPGAYAHFGEALAAWEAGVSGP